MAASDIGHAIPITYAAAALDVRYHSVASLTFLVWNCLVTLDDEVHYIWTMRNRTPFKWVYFFLRYSVIFAQAMENILIRHLANGSNPPMLCSMWRTSVLVGSQVLSTLLESILASRVFALYNRSRRIALLLLVVILAETVGTVRMLQSRHKMAFHGTCLLIRLTANSNYQCMLAFIAHCTFIGLTLVKYSFALRAGWGRTPLVSLVVRDGSIAYATILLLGISVVTLTGLRNERGIAVAFWITSLISISGCRMILSMERLARREILIESRRPLFTSGVGVRTLESGWHRANRSAA